MTVREEKSPHLNWPATKLIPEVLQQDKLDSVTVLRMPQIYNHFDLIFRKPKVKPRALLSHLVQQRVEHADTEHPAGSERQPEHEG